MTTKKQKSNSESHERKGVKRFESTTKESSMIEFISKSETIFLTSLLFVIRLAAATWGIINDCDEVYNYWEPLHLFLHGEGFQTWEYSPIYAIRSYFYIYLHYVPAVIFTHMGLSKITVFTLVRVALGIFCLSGELYAYRAISKNINNTTARLFIFFTMFSSGVFQASSAFVPSSFCMAFVFYILGAYLNENWSFGIFCVAFSTLVGWPFSAILGLAIIIRMVFVKRHILAFIKISFLSGLCIGLTQLIVDSYHFGKPVIAPMNIVLYNVLSGPGPSLYGEEPISFYIKNLIVNWNVAIIASGIGFILSLWPSIGRKNQKGVTEYVSPIVWITATTGLWLLIFGKQPHKEERFLFPIYPFIAFFTALTCDYVRRLSFNSWQIGKFVILTFAACFAILSASRVYSVHVNYGSHVDVYRSLNEELLKDDFETKSLNNTTRVCIGKEWHRFPSSFFVQKYDSNGRKVEICFLQSEFRGLLPKQFERASSLVEMTRHEPSGMNDLNREETSRYVDLNSCSYVIDVDMPKSPREPDFREMPETWKPIASKPFIDITRSTGFFGFLRAFYVPYFSVKANVMTTYTLYKQI